MKIRIMFLLAMALLVSLAPVCAEEPKADQPSRTVGSVYGKAITASEIELTMPIDIAHKFDAQNTELWQLMGRISKAFGKPINDRFVQDHKIIATEGEVVEFKKTMRESRQKHLHRTESKLKKVNTELAGPGLSEEAREKLEKKLAMYERILPRLRESAEVEFPSSMAQLFIVPRKTECELHRTYGGRVIFQQAGPEALDARRRLYEEAERKGDLVFNDAGVRHLFYYYSNMKHVLVDEAVLEKVWSFGGAKPAPIEVVVPTRKALAESVSRLEWGIEKLKRRVGALEQNRLAQMPKREPARRLPKSQQTEKRWVFESSSSESLKITPKQIVPVESGVWFGSCQPGSQPSPLGFLDFNQGCVTLLLENGSTNWSAVGLEAVAVQLDRKSLVRLRSTDQSVATWDQRPEDCNYFSQVRTHKHRFCIASPYNPLWVFDPWLETWQKIELDMVTEPDTAKLGADYYRPSLKRFAIGLDGDLWGFQRTRDATRGNAVSHYLPGQSKWEQQGFPWAMARGEDRVPIGATETSVWFRGRSDLLLYDIKTRQWKTSPTPWPAGRSGWATFTRHGVLVPVGNTVKRFLSESSTWESVATLDDGGPITAVAMLRDSLYLATASGIHVLIKMDLNQFGEPTFYPWKFADEVKSYKAVLE